MEETLGDFFQQAAVSGARIYNNTGTELVSRDNLSARTFSPADFTTVQGDALIPDEVLVAFDADQQPIELSLLNSVIPQWSPAYFSLTIFTLVNRAERRLTEADFAIALTSPNRSQSQWVIGYLHLMLDRNTLASASLKRRRPHQRRDQTLRADLLANH